VALVARREDRLNALVSDLGPNALAVPCDVTEAAQIRTAIDKIIAAFGRIDVLINNAGRGFYAPIEEIDIAAYRALLDLNTIAPLAMMQAVLPQMRRQGSGAIVNVSSGATFGILPGAAAYTSSKSALNMLSDVARTELAEIGIAVCQRRSKNQPRGGAKPGQWRGTKRHGARARQIAGACHGALAQRSNLDLGNQVAASVLRARLWASR